MPPAISGTDRVAPPHHGTPVTPAAGGLRALDAVDWITCLVILLGFAGLALARSAQSDLTGDELWTRLQIRLPFAETLPFFIRDAKHPPLYPALQMLLGVVLPDSPFGLRFLSLFAGAALPAGLFAFARRFGTVRWVAVSVAVWAGSNAAFRTEVIDARTYAFFAVPVLLHAGWLAESVLAGRRNSGRLAALAAVVVVMTHAFGFLYVGGSALALLAGAWRRDPARLPGQVRHVIGIHVLAVVAFIAWYAAAFATARGPSGIAAGLEWLEPATMRDRIVSLAEILGSSPVRFSTSGTFAAWACIFGALVLVVRRTWRGLLAVGIVATAVLLPIIAQALASGILLDLPISGTKHVLATLGPIGLAVALTAAHIGARAWWTPFTGGVLLVLSLVSLLTVPQDGRRVISLAARRYLATRDSTALQAAYTYGDLSIANFYVDRRCLDDVQLRLQFPDVHGLPDFRARAAVCEAAPAGVPVPASTRRLLLLWRQTMKAERDTRDSIAAHGWQSVEQVRSRHDPTVLEEFRRSAASSPP